VFRRGGARLHLPPYTQKGDLGSWGIALAIGFPRIAKQQEDVRRQAVRMDTLLRIQCAYQCLQRMCSTM
jgi:hypothetical protein